MARVAGRSPVLSWLAGIFCAGVVIVLLWLAIPMGPVLIDYLGDALRSIAPPDTP
ncbi:hypothetical protein [uncultured Microbacterium sp.]|uniref:hypothetical protein n=1 Tax=uncultured Microbacterium sp. TaxID=191216 RepID=UPI002602D022|nr:hypothetical protein [uncultured Microbacterium sp.]